MPTATQGNGSKLLENDPQKFPIFKPLDAATMHCKIYDLLAFLDYYSPYIGVAWKDVTVDKQCLMDIIDRVEKRRVYFWIYHNGLKMGEVNEVSLLCFWILKLNPFYDASNKSNVNIKFAVMIFMSMVNYVLLKKGKHFNIGLNAFSHIVYAFKYRDLSKEAIMALTDSILGVL